MVRGGSLVGMVAVGKMIVGAGKSLNIGGKSEAFRFGGNAILGQW